MTCFVPLVFFSPSAGQAVVGNGKDLVFLLPFHPRTNISPNDFTVFNIYCQLYPWLNLCRLPTMRPHLVALYSQPFWLLFCYIHLLWSGVIFWVGVILALTHQQQVQSLRKGFFLAEVYRSDAWFVEE